MDNQTANPNIFINQNVPQPARKWFSSKIIFIILGAIILVELVLGARSVFQSSGATQSPGQTGGLLNLAPQPGRGKIALLSDQNQVKVGDSVAVKVEVTSPTPSDGVDLVLKFDPNILRVSESDIQKGTIFPQYPLVSVDPTGVVRVSGIASGPKGGFTGKGILATINFRAIKLGVSKLSLDFTPGSTTDSNIAAGSKDLLEEVGNLEVAVK